MTCHHPLLESDDNRSLPPGEGAHGLGRERLGGGIVPRNAPPLFNLHTHDSMFWDQRVRFNATHDGFITPAPAGLLTPDMTATLMQYGVVSTQAMFPVL